MSLCSAASPWWRCSLPARLPARRRSETAGAVAARCGQRRRCRRPARTGSRRSKIASPSSIERLQRAEEARQRACRPCPGTGTSTSASSRPSATAARAGSATPATIHFPQYSNLRLDVPGRHPGHRRSTRAARWPTWATAPGVARFDSVNSDGARRLHPQRGEPAAALRSSPTTRSCAPASTSCPAPATDFALGDFVDVDLARARIPADRRTARRRSSSARSCRCSASSTKSASRISASASRLR